MSSVSNGQVVTSDDQIKDILMQHFHALFTVEDINMDLLNSITVSQLFLEHQAFLNAKITNTEIHKVVKAT